MKKISFKKEDCFEQKILKGIIIDSLPDSIDKNAWLDWTSKILERFEIKPKDLYICLREILTGKKFGPSMNDLLTIIKKMRL